MQLTCYHPVTKESLAKGKSPLHSQFVCYCISVALLMDSKFPFQNEHAAVRYFELIKTESITDGKDSNCNR